MRTTQPISIAIISWIVCGYPVTSTCTVKIPGEGSSALLQEEREDDDLFDDHTMLPFVSSRMTRSPCCVSFNAPDLFRSGLSLLATQTTVITVIFLYHKPTYLLSEFPGLKNPSSKTPPDEIIVSPSLMI